MPLPTHDGWAAAAQPGADVAAFARRSGLDLLRFAYLLCGDRHRAEDLLQDVLLSRYRRFPGELPLDNPRGYARRALANANISWARRGSTTEVVLDLFADAAAPTGSDPAERDALWQALRRLPVEQLLDPDHRAWPTRQAVRRRLGQHRVRGTRRRARAQRPAGVDG